MNHKRYIPIILIIFVLLPILRVNSSPAGEKESKITLQSLAPGENITTFTRLGMPFPDDTSGIHYFINPGDPGVLAFYVEGPDRQRHIKWVKIIRRELVNEWILSDGHQMKSMYPLGGIALGNGIGLGSRKSAIIDTMGLPGRVFLEGMGDVLEYDIDRGRLVRIHIHNDTAVSVGIYKEQPSR